MNPAHFIIGDTVILRPIEPEDLAFIQTWVNDPEVRAGLGEYRPASRHALQKWLDRVYEDVNRVWFVSVLKENNRVIGDGGFLRIDQVWRTADISICVGEKDVWRRGYGTEVMHLMLDYGFGTLNLHRIALGVFTFHEQAIRFYEAIGFRREGVLRDGIFHAHAYHDVILMSLLEDEYRAMQGPFSMREKG